MIVHKRYLVIWDKVVESNVVCLISYVQLSSFECWNRFILMTTIEKSSKQIIKMVNLSSTRECSYFKFLFTKILNTLTVLGLINEWSVLQWNVKTLFINRPISHNTISFNMKSWHSFEVFTSKHKLNLKHKRILKVYLNVLADFFVYRRLRPTILFKCT